MSFVNFMAGTAGRVLRAVVGALLVVVGFFVGGTLGVVLLVVGLLPLATGVLGVCLLAPLVGAPLTHRPPTTHP